MNEEKIKDIETIIRKEYSNIAGIVVAKEGNTLYEQYFNECDEHSRIHVYSVSKSILSILIGIAIDKGYIQSVHQKILEFFPEYNVKKNEKTIYDVTIKDLLTMSAPYTYKDSFLSYSRYFMSKDHIKFTLDRLGGKGEIGSFRYTPIIGPDILTGILRKVSGQSVLEFAQEHVFSIMNITVEKDLFFRTVKEQTDFNKATNISGWAVDSMGLQTGGWGLSLSVRDMAKVGQLYINNGVWEGKQVVSANWIQDSLSKHSKWEELNLSYGYLWWVIDEDKQIYAAMGDGGNVIYIDTQKNMVISIAALFVKNAKDMIEFIHTYIEPILEII